MKNIIKSLVLLSFFSLIVASCGKDPYDILDGGKSGANLYVTSEVKYFTGDLNFTIGLETNAGEGVTVSSIEYAVQLHSVLGESDVSTLTVEGSTTDLSVNVPDLLTTLPINGSTITESDLEPGDTFSFDFSITLSDGRSLDTPSGTLVTVLCAPAPGDYRVAMHDSYGDGWQTDDGNGGSGLLVTLDDGTEIEVGMCSPYLPSDFDCVDGDGYNAEDFISIPDGATSADWFFPGDNYGEISFEIYSPTDVLLFSYTEGDTYAGTLPIINCAN